MPSPEYVPALFAQSVEQVIEHCPDRQHAPAGTVQAEVGEHAVPSPPNMPPNPPLFTCVQRVEPCSVQIVHGEPAGM